MSFSLFLSLVALYVFLTPATTSKVSFSTTHTRDLPTNLREDDEWWWHSVFLSHIPAKAQERMKSKLKKKKRGNKKVRC